MRRSRAAAVMTVVEPCSNGLGSDAFAILWDGKQLHGLNASGARRRRGRRSYFRRKYGGGTPPQRGWDSVTVPGAVAAWVALNERFGKLPFADLMAPAVEIAERGYAVPVVVQQKWAAAAELLANQPGFAQTFLPHGRAPAIGELFRFPAAARRRCALIAADEGRGLLPRRDRAGDRTPRRGERRRDDGRRPRRLPRRMGRAHRQATTRGHTLHEIPPNGQGIAALIALGILRTSTSPRCRSTASTAQHLQIEAMKLAFADVYRYVCRAGDAMEVTTEQMLDDAYLASRAKLIDPKRAQDFGAGNPVKGGTIYLTAADERGMMVSFIQSNYMGFGSGVVVPGYGVSMQNRGHGFSLDAGQPERGRRRASGRSTPSSRPS